MQNLDALSHFFDADQITIEYITHGADRDIKVILLVVNVRLCFADIIINPATSKVWSGDSIVNRIFLRDHTEILRAIDKDRISGQ